MIRKSTIIPLKAYILYPLLFEPLSLKSSMYAIQLDVISYQNLKWELHLFVGDNMFTVQLLYLKCLSAHLCFIGFQLFAIQFALLKRAVCSHIFSIQY